MGVAKLEIPDDVTCVSASQMSTAKRCWRLWAFTYIKGMREPGGRGAAFGNRVHEVHEDYLNGISVPDLAETWTVRAHLKAAGEPVPEGLGDSSLDRAFYPGSYRRAST